MTVTLGKLERVSPDTVWESESRDFTPWLAKNLGLLGEALGLDLELVQTEASVGGFSCDIEAKDSNSGRTVVIENQLGETDHDHLGKLMTYAAGRDAGGGVWIASDIREEHRAAIDFLNRKTGESIGFFLVALEVVQIGKSEPAVNFRPVASPNAWARPGRPAISDKMLAYQEFWQPLIDELREKHRFTNAKATPPQNWYSFASGAASGITYGVAFAKGNRLQAEVYIAIGDAGPNKAIFDYLEASKAEIEKAIGDSLSWERLDAKQGCRIAVVRKNTTIEDAPEHGDEMRAWLIERLLKLKQVFGPRLKAAVQHAANQQAA